jgi:hypothetical protein
MFIENNSSKYRISRLDEKEGYLTIYPDPKVSYILLSLSNSQVYRINL